MTVKDFFENHLGGAANVAREIGVPYTTVAQWQQFNRIPPWRLPKVIELALKAGKAVPADFGPATPRRASERAA